MEIAIRDLKARLSHVLAQAQAGEVIEVTSHRKPVARIVGIAPQADEPLSALMVAGALSWHGGKPRFAAPLVLAAGGTPLGQLVLEGRE
jgi:prevent-host-death family protein